MEEQEKIRTFKVFNAENNWYGFEVDILCGKVLACRGAVKHPVGSDWKSLSSYYEKMSGDMAATIEEVFDEPVI